MTENEYYNEIEQLLRNYLPAGPSEDLRERVLSSAHSQSEPHPRRRRQVWSFRAAAAAVLLVAVVLRFIPIALILATAGKGN